MAPTGSNRSGGESASSAIATASQPSLRTGQLASTLVAWGPSASLEQSGDRLQDLVQWDDVRCYV